MPQIKSEYDDLDKYKNVNGDIWYYKKDTRLFHNPYGPAIIVKDGSIKYYINGSCHRLDGPAIIYANGLEYYCINGLQLNKEQFEKYPERLKYLGKEYLICLT